MLYPINYRRVLYCRRTPNKTMLCAAQLNDTVEKLRRRLRLLSDRLFFVFDLYYATLIVINVENNNNKSLSSGMILV